MSIQMNPSQKRAIQMILKNAVRNQFYDLAGLRLSKSELARMAKGSRYQLEVEKLGYLFEDGRGGRIELLVRVYAKGHRESVTARIGQFFIGSHGGITAYDHNSDRAKRCKHGMRTLHGSDALIWGWRL